MTKDLVGGLVALGGNGFAWLAHTEQIWFPMAATYVRHLSEMFGLPDLRGPFIFLTLAYVGLRLSDLLDARDDVDETL